jgi:hypothetical protein
MSTRIGVAAPSQKLRVMAASAWSVAGGVRRLPERGDRGVGDDFRDDPFKLFRRHQADGPAGEPRVADRGGTTQPAGAGDFDHQLIAWALAGRVPNKTHPGMRGVDRRGRRRRSATPRRRADRRR